MEAKRLVKIGLFLSLGKQELQQPASWADELVATTS
jgi:hypothetical protein